MKRPRTFNTSGPNRPEQHYTLKREALVNKGLRMVERNQYFTLWAPRQSGKSTFFELLSTRLRQKGYKVAQVNFEAYSKAEAKTLMKSMAREAKRQWGVDLPTADMHGWQRIVREQNEAQWVLIIDELEGLNPQLLPNFLHTIRSLFHFRDEHALKGVIFVGLANLQTTFASLDIPFNIADSLQVPYFTQNEVYELLELHEAETAQSGQPQVFAEAVKEKIWQMTAGQPGLVNGFAEQLVKRYPDVTVLDMQHYQRVEDWYAYEVLDKNTTNIIYKAQTHRRLIEGLLYLDLPISFQIDQPAHSFLYANGVIDYDSSGRLTFPMPLYKKRIELTFAINNHSYNEREQFFSNGFYYDQAYTATGQLNWQAIAQAFQHFAQNHGFSDYRQINTETGEYQTIEEAAVVYAFEAFLALILQREDTRSYRDTQAGLGNSYLKLQVSGKETILKLKIYQNTFQYEAGLEHLKQYATGLQTYEALYVVFFDKSFTLPAQVTAQANTQQALANGTTLSVLQISYASDSESPH